MPTSLSEELTEQSRWQAEPAWAKSPIADRFVRNEFRSAEEQAARWDAAVRDLLSYAGAHVPYYRNLLRQCGLSAEDFDGLRKLSLLPLLTKSDIQRDPKQFRSEKLPDGHDVAMILSSSGTTGEPVAVAHTSQSRSMLSLLKQRELRWFRFDPKGKLAYIRAALDLPRHEDGRYVEVGETLRLAGWMYIRNICQTGPFVCFSDKNEIDKQLEWLSREQPDYLVCNAPHLEHLALAAQDLPRIANLKAAQAVSSQFTEEMRHRVHRTFGIPTHQNYGLNEIGIVAARCPEGGRYHVHVENCVLEIVDEEGNPCRPGEKGRVLVTALRNAAMPLIRYDADDLAVLAEGPCPCGRTLPAFAEIIGRYRRSALLPPGTQAYWIMLLELVHQHFPKDLTRCLRKYQLHQFRDDRFELRMTVAGDGVEALISAIHAAWQAHGGPQAKRLTIRVVDDIPRPRGGKFQNFTSDFVPPQPGTDGASVE